MSLYTQFLYFTIIQMTTRTTSNGYKVTITNDEWIEDFHYYDDLWSFCFKDVSRDYKLLNDLDLHEWEIDYLVGNKSKEDIIDEDDGYICDEDFEKLDKLKDENVIVWLTFRDYGWWCISVTESTNHYNEYDGFVMVKKEDGNCIKWLIKEFNAWMTGEIYVVSIYEPRIFTAENWEKIRHWDYIDGCGGYMDYDDAKNNIPWFVWELQNESDYDRWNEFEFC